MRRLSVHALTLAVLAPVMVGLPVVSLPAAAAKPVTPVVRFDDVELKDGRGRPAASVAARTGPDAAPTVPADAAGDMTSEEQSPGEFTLVGLSWSPGAGETPQLAVRTRYGSGGWGEWTDLDVTDAASTGARMTTEPLYVGRSSAVQVRSAGARPDDLEVITVDPGRSAADSAPTASGLLGGEAAVASAASTQPRIITRAQWGADEQMRTSACPGGPSYSSTIKAGAVHHTAGSNSYTAADSASIVRGIYAYHVRGNGWCDVGYNFLVDKYGQVFEGRYGGMDRPVLGAHAGGFNTNTFGVSMLGNYDTASVPAAALDAMAGVISWKLSLHNLDGQGTATLTSGGSSKYPAGTKVDVGVVFGHRDVSSTSCPGQNLFALLPDLRRRVVALNAPFGSVDEIAPSAGAIRFRGWVIDPRTPDPAQVHIYIGSVGHPFFADRPRGDVGAAYPSYGSNHGFDVTVATSPGVHRVCLYAIPRAAGVNSTLTCRNVEVMSGSPFGSFDAAAAGPSGVFVRGWAIDPDSVTPIQTHVYVDGVGNPLIADADRPDVGRAFPGYGPRHGFDAVVPAAPGQRQACAYAINSGPGGHQLIGCRSVAVLSGSPFGSLDAVTAVDGGVRVRGWALDPDSADKTRVTVTVDVTPFLGSTGTRRADVGRAYPGWGPDRGFDTTVPAGPGIHKVCVALGNAGPGRDAQFDCTILRLP